MPTLETKQVVCLEILFLKRDLLAVIPTDYNNSLTSSNLTSLVRERDQSPSIVQITTDLLFRSEEGSESESCCLWYKENGWSRLFPLNPNGKAATSKLWWENMKTFLTAKNGLQIFESEILIIVLP